jgi:hypothetical protein
VEYSLNRPLTPDKATKLINKIITYAECTVDITGHCREKMRETHFDFQDLLLVLSNGKVKSPAEYDKKHGHYKYKVEGPTLDDNNVVVIAVILGSRILRIITIY